MSFPSHSSGPGEDDLARLTAVVRGLAALADNTAHIPLTVQPVTATRHTVRFRVVDVWGEVPVGLTVRVSLVEVLHGATTILVRRAPGGSRQGDSILPIMAEVDATDSSLFTLYLPVIDALTYQLVLLLEPTSTRAVDERYKPRQFSLGVDWSHSSGGTVVYPWTATDFVITVGGICCVLHFVRRLLRAGPRPPPRVSRSSAAPTTATDGTAKSKTQ
jgi:hypothetical protein